MNNELTLQLFAFDCNAIPDEQRNHALAAIKKFGKLLRESGRKQTVSGVRFTRDEEVYIKNQPLEKVKVNRLLENEHSGVCCMLDRMAGLMNEAGVILNDPPEPERPSQVIMTIIVFGRDNASTHYTYDRLREMVALQRDVYKWKFLLMTDFTINMEKLGIAEEDTILIKKSENDWFKRPFDELGAKMLELFPKD